MKKELSFSQTKRLRGTTVTFTSGSLLDLWQDNPRFKAGYLNKFPGYFSGDMVTKMRKTIFYYWSGR
jgi:acyl-coenzyme A synthetase/AMP-(fatty) acid ligase